MVSYLFNRRKFLYDINTKGQAEVFGINSSSNPRIAEDFQYDSVLQRKERIDHSAFRSYSLIGGGYYGPGTYFSLLDKSGLTIQASTFRSYESKILARMTVRPVVVKFDKSVGSDGAKKEIARRFGKDNYVSHTVSMYYLEEDTLTPKTLIDQGFNSVCGLYNNRTTDLGDHGSQIVMLDCSDVEIVKHWCINNHSNHNHMLDTVYQHLGLDYKKYECFTREFNRRWMK